MRLSVTGCGYLDAVHAVPMAELGHNVMGVGVDAHKVNFLSNGRTPLSEPELEEFLARDVEARYLTFTQSLSAIKGAQVRLIGMDTSQSGPEAVDMTYVDAVMTTMFPHLGHRTSGPEAVTGKFTVPAGTAARLSQLIEPIGALLLWNPEFLREGFAIQDTLRLDRMVYSPPENSDAAGRAQEAMDAVYAQVLAADTPRLAMDCAATELVKISASAFLATKIPFINAMPQVCDAVGTSVTILAEVIGMDDRIGHRFLCAGIGSGGGCLSKDIRTFQAHADELSVGDALAFLAGVGRVSGTVRAGVIRAVAELFVEHTSTATVAILGVAFEPDSDDMRSPPALDLTVELSGMVERVIVHDPAADPILAQRTDHPYEVTASAQYTLEGTDLAIIGTEWREYQGLDSTQAASLVRNCYIIDRRNYLGAQTWKAVGWSYRGIGRQ